MNKKILTITTIAVLVSSIMTIAMINDAQADSEVDVADFKCDKSFGSFYTPTALGQVNTGSWADCSVIGQAGLASHLQIVPGADDGCVGIVSATDSFLVNEKGFITFSTTGTQCFFDDSGDALTADPVGFCGVGEASTSTLTGTYTMTDGLVDGKRVVGGTGTIASSADHCAGNSAPLGNSGVTSLQGDIHTVVEP